MPRNSVQFFGLPGSGKTSLLNSLAQNYPDKYLRVPKLGRSKRLKLSLQFAVSFPGVFFSFISLIFRNDWRLWGYISHLVSQSFASHVYAIKHRSGEKLFLIDEGVLQRLLTIAPSAFTAQQVERLVKMQNVLSCRPVVVTGGDFGRFVSEPDRMMSYRNRLGIEYFKKWSEDMVKNFKAISLQIHGTVIIEKGGSVEALHRSINS